jgi:hypothetical protein
MKTLAALAIFCLTTLVHHACSTKPELPIERVVSLIAELKARVEQDGKEEQAVFDKYACWCEDTLERKSADIASGKEIISETEILIKKLKGEIASHGAEIEQLNRDLAQNAAASKDATDLRNKEYGDYGKERTESENCIGALEGAIKVMTGAGTGKKGFLETSAHQAQLLSIAGQVRRVLRHSAMPQSITTEDLDVVKSFVAKPMEFFNSHSMSAAQMDPVNPFGDYAPQSTQIQGILKGMYDGFTQDLEKDNAAEAESEKTFQALMATKLQEKAALEATLMKQEADKADKTKRLADSEVLLEDTTKQLEADETFFADTKEACQAKAAEWSVRTRLRTEELNGMTTAIKILSSESAKGTFHASATTFLQMSSINRHAADRSQASTKIYGMLKRMAKQYKSLQVARMAVLVQSGGHFDKVIAMIDMMIADLREEEQDDITHRDLCQDQQNANKNEMLDLDAAIKKTEASLKRMEAEKKDIQDEIEALEKDIEKTKNDQDELLQFRNKEVEEFRQALKDDSNAIDLMKQASITLEKFYKDNNIPLNLAQKPEYTKNPDKAPETWSEPYGGRKSENTGILAILAMLVEDVEKEMKEARADDAEAQAEYEKQNGALQATLDAQEVTKASLETELADLEAKMRSYEKYHGAKTSDLGAEDDTNKALYTECAWVKTHFDSRREKRKKEIEGLQEAKDYLAGVESGKEDLGF